jgi:hypothetical protein
MNKTLIGKNGYLFLTNDSAKELEVHCNNLNLVDENNLSNYNFDNFLLIVIPNRCLIYKDFLPDNYVVNYRPAFEIYKNKLQEKIIDTFEFLKYENDVYYKTDTHINLKGNYIIYNNFIQKINEKYNLNITPAKIDIKQKICELIYLVYGVGDLTWPENLGDQYIHDKNDTFYYSDDIIEFYPVYLIDNNKPIRFLNHQLDDKTNELANQNTSVRWNIISNYIIYKHNPDKKNKVIIFYDSFLLSALPLYLDLFNEVYMIKYKYNNNFISLINPDYVFEFRVERFLM